MKMKLRGNKSLPIISAIDYVIVFLIVLGSQSVFSVTIDQDFHLNTLLILILAIRIVLDINLVIRKSWKVAVFSVIWAIYILLYVVARTGNVVSLLTKFCIMMILMVVWIHINFERKRVYVCFRYYCNIIFFIAIISLCFWVLGSIFGLIHPSGTINIDWGRDRTISNYFYIYFQWQNDAIILGQQRFRNIGIFAEAPMYSLHLCIAFMFEYLILKTKNKFRMIIYIITIISTVSITGYLLLLIVLISGKVGEFVMRLIQGRKVKKWMIVIPPIAVIGVIVGVSFLSGKLASASGSSRIDDYISGFMAWKDNIFFGAGYGDIETRISYSSAARLARSSYGYTNSIMYVLSEGGIYFFACYFFSFAYLILESMKHKKYNIMLFTLMWLYLFLTTVFPHTPIMICWIAYAFAKFFKKNITLSSKKRDV